MKDTRQVKKITLTQADRKGLAVFMKEHKKVLGRSIQRTQGRWEDVFKKADKDVLE